jgi:DNA-binding transcriptional MerR regulator
MIVINEKHFIDFAKKRGYNLEDVIPCVKHKHPNGNWAIDETHVAYPRPKNQSHEEFLETLQTSRNVDIGKGVGTELKDL